MRISEAQTVHDVIIIGAGPVGTLLAGELALHGLDVVVLEQRSEPSLESKAGTLHQRTAQLLKRRGLLDAVQPYPASTMPRRSHPVTFHFGGIFKLDLARVAAEEPVLIGSPQAYAEQVFAQRAQTLGATILRGRAAKSLSDNGDHVWVSTETVNGDVERFAARWVVGCDGARSTTRKSAGIKFVGSAPTLSALMGEVQLLDPANAPVGWQRNVRGWTLFWINPFGHSRVSTYDFRSPPADRSAPVTFDEFRGEVERIAGRPVPMTKPRWLTRFTDAALVAETYRKGRVLVAGDAAHVNFPAGGQGLNLGLEDAINLGWKLAAEIQGWAPRGLLDTYHVERSSAAEGVMQNVRAQVGLMNPDPRTDSLRELFAALMEFDEVNDYLSRSVSGVSVRYGGIHSEPLVGTMVDDFEVDTGQSRVLASSLLHTAMPLYLDSTGSSELLSVARQWEPRISVMRVASLGQLDREAVLLRPDGYAVWSGDSCAGVEHLSAALRKWFGNP